MFLRKNNLKIMEEIYYGEKYNKSSNVKSIWIRENL